MSTDKEFLLNPMEWSYEFVPLIGKQNRRMCGLYFGDKYPYYIVYEKNMLDDQPLDQVPQHKYNSLDELLAEWRVD